MTTNSRVISFLENDDLIQLLLTLTQEQVKNQSLQLNDPKNAANRTCVSTYQSLASEYTQFLDSEYLDNIELVISGIDGAPFSSTGGKLLIAEARRRLESPLFGSRLGIHECESELNVLWFSPVPINIKNLGQEDEEIIKKNVIRYFNVELGLTVNDVSLSILTDGAGWEKFFYECYFVPKKFMEITGISEQLQLPPCSEYKESIMDYIQEGKTESLKALVKEQLPHPLDFDINLPELFVPSESTALFMPFFRVCLNVASTTTATAIINKVNQHFQVLECTEADGCLTMECMSSEGPFAETVSDILVNIRELLGPYIMQFFNKNDLNPLSLTFILTN